MVHDYSFSVFSERKKEMGVLIREGGVFYSHTNLLILDQRFFG